eukprot:IDg18032t1
MEPGEINPEEIVAAHLAADLPFSSEDDEPVLVEDIDHAMIWMAVFFAQIATYSNRRKFQCFSSRSAELTASLLVSYKLQATAIEVFQIAH